MGNIFVKRCTIYLSNVRQYLFQTLKTPFSSVRQHSLQILDNILDKRLKTPLSNYDLHIPISFISMRYLLLLMDKQHHTDSLSAMLWSKPEITGFSTTLRPRGLPSVINIERQSQSCVSMFQLNLLMFINAFSNLDNIIIKR